MRVVIPLFKIPYNESLYSLSFYSLSLLISNKKITILTFFSSLFLSYGSLLKLCVEPTPLPFHVHAIVICSLN